MLAVKIRSNFDPLDWKNSCVLHIATSPIKEFNPVNVRNAVLTYAVVADLNSNKGKIFASTKDLSTHLSSYETAFMFNMNFISTVFSKYPELNNLNMNGIHLQTFLFERATPLTDKPLKFPSIQELLFLNFKHKRPDISKESKEDSKKRIIEEVTLLKRLLLSEFWILPRDIRK